MDKKMLAILAAALAIVFLIFAFAGYVVAIKTASQEPLDKGAIKMNITMSGFEPNIIRAKAGEPVKINLVNPDNSMHTDGGGVHNFILTAGLASVNVTVPSESQKVFTFTPTQIGEYHWYCDICCGGKENPYMHGILIVT
ncbi:MAG: cupredoxin domain-containing protein [Candidatus Methanoperedens sp.]